MSYRDDENWLKTCEQAYHDMQIELIPLVKRVFNIEQVEFTIVDPQDFNYKLSFQYRGLDVIAQYISGCGEWFMTAGYKGYDDVYLNQVPWEAIEFETLFANLKVVLDLIDY